MNRKNTVLSFVIVLAMFILSACAGSAGAQNQADATTTAGAQVAATSPLSATSTAIPILQTALPQATIVPATGAAAGTTDLSSLRAFESVFENLYAVVNPSVVNIHVFLSASSGSSGLGQLPPGFGNPGAQTPSSEALGSGFVWDDQGNIVTNNHVVEGATSVSVTFADGTTLSAKVVGTDPQSDLAVVKVNAPSGLLHPVTLADSKQVKVGQVVIAIGNPFGLQGTMTQGIISALGRSLPVGLDTQTQSANMPTYSIPDIIQTDAAINPGNSGGVLINDTGQVIGVTAAIASNAQSNSGIGFVIPSSIVQEVVPQLIQGKTVQHPYLGVSGVSLSPDLNQAMNLNASQRGALVVQVVPGGPAANAGLRASTQQVTINGQNALVGGDVVTAVDGHPITTMDDLIAYLNDNTSVGQTVTLTVLRNGQQTSVKVTLAPRPANATPLQPTTTQP